jgi:acetoin utilization deacetylase AcuC-like enzyme
VRVSYHDGYVVPLPERHPFPMGKFEALRNLLVREGIVRPDEIVQPREADWSDLLLVHTRDYLNRLASGELTSAEVRRMGLPWSDALVRRSRLAVQGTINAASMALSDGVAGNLAGGTHHAMPGHAEGFCVLNDVAVALRTLQRSRWISRALIVDLDVHQGNGNAAFFGAERAWPAGGVFTLSVHGEKNFPFHKPPSTVDVPLPDGTADDVYLDTLSACLDHAIAQSQPDLIVYLGGVDVLSGDRFGRLALTPAGLAERDALVCAAVKRADIPLCLVLSGGYARRDGLTSGEDTADHHATMFREAARAFESG